MKWTVFVFPLTRRRTTNNQRAYVDPRADRRAARIKANLHFHVINMHLKWFIRNECKSFNYLNFLDFFLLDFKSIQEFFNLNYRNFGL